jgi:type II secretory pathway component GspD/PulD (secretin)
MHKSVAAVCLGGALLLSTTVSGDASKIQSVRVEQSAESTSFVISKMGAMDIEDFLMEDPPRLVVDFVGATHGLDKNLFEGDGTFVNRVRTSQFTNEPDQITRLVFDLNKDVSYQLSHSGEDVTVTFFPKGTSVQEKPRTMASSVAPMGMSDVGRSKTVQPRQAEDHSAADEKAAATKPAAKPSQSAAAMKPAASTKQTQAAAPATPDWSKPAKPATPVKPQPQVATNWKKPSSAQKSAAPSTLASRAQTTNSYGSSAGLVLNKNITMDVQNADIKTVLRSMSEFSNTNIISGPEVEGKVTAHLKQVPWRQALDIVLKAHGFGWREEYGVIRVATMENLTKEELELQTAERQKDALLPLVTRIIPISFNNAGEMRSALKEILTDRGSMEVEVGNNALIVTDIDRTVDKISMMVADLDRKIKQVEIVAKLIDVDFEATREMGIRWDALNLALDDVNAVGDAVINARSGSPIGTFRMGTINSWGQLQATIDLLEKEQKANIISNPRIVTTDNREASILVGKEIPLIVSDEAGNPITELTKVGIILRVTPHVNSDNSITLDLHPEVSELSSQATVQGGVIISLSEADTRVVVGDGQTAVIGGLVNEVESSLQNGVPGLMHLPIIGKLFKSESKTTKKRELIIFVTPRIIEGVASNE